MCLLTKSQFFGSDSRQLNITKKILALGNRSTTKLIVADEKAI